MAAAGNGSNNINCQPHLRNKEVSVPPTDFVITVWQFVGVDIIWKVSIRLVTSFMLCTLLHLQ